MIFDLGNGDMIFDGEDAEALRPHREAAAQSFADAMKAAEDELIHPRG